MIPERSESGAVSRAQAARARTDVALALDLADDVDFLMDRLQGCRAMRLLVTMELDRLREVVRSPSRWIGFRCPMCSCRVVLFTFHPCTSLANLAYCRACDISMEPEEDHVD